MTLRQRVNSRLPSALLLVHIVLPVGLWIAVWFGRPRFVGFGLYFVAAILLVDVLVVLAIRDRPMAGTVIAGVQDVRVPAILLLGSLVVLALFGSGPLFYAGVTFVLVIVLARAFALKGRATSARADLVLVSGAAILLLSSQVFTVAYYANTPDTINHTSTALVLSEAGWLSAISSTRYYTFAAFHILASAGIQYTNLEPRLLIAVLMIILFQLALLALYLFFRQWSYSRTLALIATVLVSINTAFIHYGSLAHYQSMSFVLFVVFLYLLYRGSWTGRDIIVAVPIMTAWIATHHVSILIAISLMAFPIGYPAVRSWWRGTNILNKPTLFLFSVFCLMFGAYWTVITAKFREVLIWVFFTSGAAEGVPSRVYLVETHDSIEQLLVKSLPFFVDSLHYSFLAALGLIGIWVVLTTDMFGDLRWRAVLLGFVPAAIIYFPNPVWIPLEALLPFRRFRLMVLPFLVLIPAIGLQYSANPANGTKLRQIGVVLFTAAFVFTTITSGMAHPGLTDLAGFQKDPQQHFTNEELDATDFVYAHMNDRQMVYSRSNLHVYLRQYAWALQKPASLDQFAKIQASHTDRRLAIAPGLTVVSTGAFRGEGFQAELTALNSSQYGDYEIVTSVHANDYRWDRTNTSVVYTSGQVVVQHE